MAAIDKTKVRLKQKKPWRARVMFDYMAVDLGYHETEEQAIAIEDNFRACLTRWRQTGRWTGAGARQFREAYDRARLTPKRSQRASATNPAIKGASGSDQVQKVGEK